MPILRERLEILFPKIRYLPRIFGQKIGVTPGTLTPAQKALAQRLKEELAKTLGVPSEAINEEVVERWVINWSKAFVKPEYWTYLSRETREALGV